MHGIKNGIHINTRWCLVYTLPWGEQSSRQRCDTMSCKNQSQHGCVLSFVDDISSSSNAVADLGKKKDFRIRSYFNF